MLGGPTSEGVSKQARVPQKEEPCQEQTDRQLQKHRVSIPTVWSVKFNREELKGKANLLPRHACAGPMNPIPALRRHKIGWVLFVNPPPLDEKSLWPSFLSQF